MESRNCYGWGLIGSNKKGFEWLLVYGEKAYEKMRKRLCLQDRKRSN